MKIGVLGRVAILSAAAAVVVGCSSEGPTAPKTSPSGDLATILGQMSLSGLGNLTAGPGTFNEGMVPAATVWNSADCVYSAATRSFTCPPITRGGMTYTRSFTLYDAAGNPQSALDGNTASIRTITTATGTIYPPGTFGPIALDRREDMTMSGLNVGQPTLNGTSTSTMNTTMNGIGGPAQRLAMIWADTTANLVLPPRGAGFPRSGSIAMTATTTTTPLDGSSAPVTTSFREVITFDGTSTVTIRLYIGTSVVTCKQTLGSF